MTSSHFRNYLQSVPCALEDLVARTLQSIVNPVQLLVYFAGILALTILPHLRAAYNYYSAYSKTRLLCLPVEHHRLYARLWFTTSGDNE